VPPATQGDVCPPVAEPNPLHYDGFHYVVSYSYNFGRLGFPRYGKLGFWAVFECATGARGCSPRAVERSTRRPLSTVERDRPKWPGKWCPMKSGSALSRSRLGCGVVARPFSGREVGDFSRSQVRRGRCVRSVDLL